MWVESPWWVTALIYLMLFTWCHFTHTRWNIWRHSSSNWNTSTWISSAVKKICTVLNSAKQSHLSTCVRQPPKSNLALNVTESINIFAVCKCQSTLSAQVKPKENYLCGDTLCCISADIIYGLLSIFFNIYICSNSGNIY